MRAVVLGQFDDGERGAWLEALAAARPDVQWITDPAPGTRADVAVVANPPRGSLSGLAGLRLIQSLWAGIDRLVSDDTLPADLPLARMVDPAMTAAMAETVLWAVLALHRGFFAYAERQRQRQWRTHAQRRADEVPVLVLGQGTMGAAASQRLRLQGYSVDGWRRSDGDAALWQALPRAAIVVNLLPLTPATYGLLDTRAFAAMAPRASLVNLARGAHVVEADLLAALDCGHLRHAVLDVFQVEPLPPAHPFWRHPKVTVLPHAAAATDPRSAAQVVAENLRRLAAGEPILHLVDRVRGY